jgi:hypothetical protein
MTTLVAPPVPTDRIPATGIDPGAEEVGDHTFLITVTGTTRREAEAIVADLVIPEDDTGFGLPGYPEILAEELA